MQRATHATTTTTHTTRPGHIAAQTDLTSRHAMPRHATSRHSTKKRRGEVFDRSRHECGTEVKAITYSAMQIREDAAGDAEVFVIVDI